MWNGTPEEWSDGAVADQPEVAGPLLVRWMGQQSALGLVCWTKDVQGVRGFVFGKGQV